MRTEQGESGAATTQLDDARARRAVLAALAALMALQLLRPGDIPFINDEPDLIGKAFVANQSGMLADKGLLGSFGVQYAPVCVWIYQLLLTITNDIVSLAAIKIAVVWLGVWIAVWRLASLTRLSPWPLLLIPLSPFLWFFQRLLWDNVFLIPVSAGMTASLAAFLARPRSGPLVLWAALSALAFHVHVMAALPIAAGVVALVLFQRDWLHANRGKVVAISLVALALSARYLYAILVDRGARGHAQTEVLHSLEGATHGFLLWSHAGFQFYLESFYRGSRAIPFLQSIPGWSALAAGIVSLAGFAVSAVRRPVALREWPIDRQLALLSAMLVLGQVALFVALRLEPLWHYFNGVWLGFFYLLWWGFDRVREHLWARVWLVGQGLTVGVLTVLVAVHVQVHHGDRTQRYGATLANQVDVARRVAEHKPRSIERRVENYGRFPHALQVLVLLEAARTRTKLDAFSGLAVVDYVGASADDGLIDVEFGRPETPQK